MARDYQLAMGAKKKFSATIIPKESPKGDAPEDGLPMHREVGQDVTIAYNDSFILGRVVAVKDALTCLIEADGEMYFEKGQDITHLPESARCTHCGQFAFLCSSDCPVKKRKPNKRNMARESKTVNVADVLDIRPGDQDEPAWVNGDFECVVTKVKEASGNGPIKATLVHPEDDGCKITANFWKWKMSDVEELEGKLVSFNGGMTRTEYKPKQGPKMQQVSISSKTEVRIIGESAHSEKPLPHKPSPHRDNGRDAAAGDSVRSGGSLVTARKAIFDKFRLLGLVNKAYKAMKDQHNLPEMTGGELSTFATGVGISIMRGESIPDAVFADVKPEPDHSYSEEALANEPEQGWEAPPKRQSTERPKSSWESFVHPKRKVALGKIDDSDLMTFAKWALSLGDAPDDDVARNLYTNLLVMMEEKGWGTAVDLFSERVKAHEDFDNAFTIENIEAAIGCKVEDLNEEQAMEALDDFDGIIDAAIKDAQKPKKTAKGGKNSASMPE